MKNDEEEQEAEGFSCVQENTTVPKLMRIHEDYRDAFVLKKIKHTLYTKLQHICIFFKTKITLYDAVFKESQYIMYIICCGSEKTATNSLVFFG